MPSISLLPSTSACDAAAPWVSEFAETSKLEEIVYKANTKVSINTYYIAVRVLQSAEDADCENCSRNPNTINVQNLIRDSTNASLPPNFEMPENQQTKTPRLQIYTLPFCFSILRGFA